MEIDALNWFDIYIITIILVSSILAFFSGFIKSLFSFITIFSTIALSIYLYNPVKNGLEQSMHNSKLATALASAGLFFLLLIIISFISSRLIMSMNNYRHGILDRTMGFIFGFVRGFIIAVLMFISVKLILISLNLDKDDAPAWSKEFRDSSIYQLLDNYSGKIAILLPDEIYKKYAKAEKKLDNSFIMNEEIKKIALSDKVANLIKKVMSALPVESSSKFEDRYTEKTRKLSDSERLILYKNIFNEYKRDLKLGRINKDKILAMNEINELDNALNIKLSPENNSDTGKNNLKQLDRLIDTLK